MLLTGEGAFSITPPTMAKITIKLLHERKSGLYRKVDGSSGKLYTFAFNERARAYCFTTDKQIEIDDLFAAQGRNSGVYFAPVLVDEPTEQLSDEMALALVARGLSVTPAKTINEQAKQLVNAYDLGDSLRPLRGPDGRFTGEGHPPASETYVEAPPPDHPAPPAAGATPDAAPMPELGPDSVAPVAEPPAEQPPAP